MLHAECNCIEQMESQLDAALTSFCLGTSSRAGLVDVRQAAVVFSSFGSAVM